MAQSDLTRVIEPACQKLAQQFGFELVDVELAREGASRYLRIYIDKPDGITLSDCETYHRAVAPLVERVDYDFLEVCSPGLDRPLKKQKDFDKHAGEMVEIHLFRPIERRKQFETVLRPDGRRNRHPRRGKRAALQAEGRFAVQALGDHHRGRHRNGRGDERR